MTVAFIVAIALVLAMCLVLLVAGVREFFRHEPDYVKIHALEHELGYAEPGDHHDNCWTCVAHNAPLRQQLTRADEPMRAAVAQRLRQASAYSPPMVLMAGQKWEPLHDPHIICTCRQKLVFTCPVHPHRITL